MYLHSSTHTCNVHTVDQLSQNKMAKRDISIKALNYYIHMHTNTETLTYTCIDMHTETLTGVHVPKNLSAILSINIIDELVNYKLNIKDVLILTKNHLES